MKRIILFLIMQTALFSLLADDGGVTNVEDWTYGNIYVKEPNDKIALEKELMVCDMDSLTAVFVFKNTTADTVTVDCAFPMDVKLPYTKSIKKTEHELWRCYSLRVLRILLGTKDTLNPVEVIGDWGSIALNDRVKELVLQHDKELRVMDMKQYFQYIDSVLREHDHKDELPICRIDQDGKPVTLLNVGIESSVSPEEISLRFHFHHQLTFLPNAYSKVVVRYGVESLKQSYEDDYSYSYDISTGGTWKGNIHSFMVVTRNCSMGSNPTFDYLCCDELYECGIYFKKEYKPKAGDRFYFNNYDQSALDRDYYPDPTYEMLRPVPLQDVKASSWLNPSAIMDKSQFTSCAIVNWREASLEFTLPQDGFGPFLCNGTNGNLVTEKDLYAFEDLLNTARNKKEISDDDEIKEFFQTDFSIYDNNWVKEISIVRLDNPLDTFSYHVEKTNMREFPLLYDWQRISAVRKLSYFPAGRYRLFIKDCYPGNDSQDTTCVTEFWFMPMPHGMAEMMAEDKSSKFPIFQHVFDLVGEKSFRDYLVPLSYEMAETETPALLITREYKKEYFGNKKFHRIYPNVSQQEEEQKSFPILYVVIGSLVALAVIGGVVYWRRKR